MWVINKLSQEILALADLFKHSFIGKATLKGEIAKMLLKNAEDE